MEQNKRLFGTNGIRGIPNSDMTPEFAMDIGKAIGTYFNGTIVIGRDTRSTGDMIKSSVVAGLLSMGNDVIDLGMLPTPAIQYYAKTHMLYGVIITASHNPPMYNGIKAISNDGTELDREDEIKIEEIYWQKKFKKVSWDSVGNYSYVNDAIDIYINGVMKKVDVSTIAKKTFKVLVDPGNGAAYFSTPYLLRKLGCSVVTLNANPDGKFTSRNAEPKPENLGNLIDLMKTGKFDLGIAHDGDADRAVFVDENGNFIDGDKSLALIVSNVAKRGDKVVTPISSSDAILDICRKNGSELIRTRVGAPVVARAMIENGAVIGGEENGGVIYGKHQYCRDGAMTVSLILESMARSEKKVSELIAELPQYSMEKLQIERKVEWEKIRNEIIKSQKADETDGIKINEKDGWVLIRPSGTEKIIRIYGESKDPERAKDIAERYFKMIEKIQESS
ncbi:MAG: phosphoglucosamine mutase [Thermoplasmata archaeon]